MGQTISGEAGRGLGFFGGYVGCWVIYSIGYAKLIKSTVPDIIGSAIGSVITGETVEPEPEPRGGGLIYFGLLGVIIVDIWAIADAVRVAKVNNLAWRDKHRTGIKIHIQSYVNHFQTNDKINARMGLRVKLLF